MVDYSDPRRLGDYLARLIAMFDEAEDASQTMREKAERDVDYYDGKQWTEAEARELRRRGQPVQSQNVIRDKIDYWLGLEKDQRTDPRALPRTPAHEEESHAATDALRFVADENRWPAIRSAVWSDILRAGWGGVEVVAEPQPSGEWRIAIRRTPWDRMFWDPYSSAEDFSDARYRGLVRWLDREQALLEYGEGAAAVYDETVAGGQSGNTFDDKPKHWRWVSSDRKRIRVIQLYHVGEDGAWQFCEFTRGGILQAGLSPWIGEDGTPDHPYEWRSAYMDRDNARYGAIRDMIDVQDAINKRLSKFLHQVSVRQTFGVQGLVPGDVREMRRQLARPDGHVELSMGAEFGKHFGVIPTGDMAEGQFELLAQALQRFENMGPNAALMGESRKSQSGRAILANQQGGFIQLGTLFDSLRSLDRGVFRKAWGRIRQFWTGEIWVRVTDNEQNLKWVGINVPAVDEATGAPMIDPATGMLALQNEVGRLDVDIIIDDAPDSANIQSEQFGQLVELAQVGVVFPPSVYLEASSLRNKGRLMQMMREAQQHSPEAARAAEAEIAGAEAKAAETAARAQKTQVETQRLLFEPLVQPAPMPMQR